MKKRHEQMMEHLLEIGKKNRFLKYAVLVLMFFEVLRYHLSVKLLDYPVKICYLLSVVVIFFIESSFIYLNENVINSETDNMIGQEANDYCFSTSVNAAGFDDSVLCDFGDGAGITQGAVETSQSATYIEDNLSVDTTISANMPATMEVDEDEIYGILDVMDEPWNVENVSGNYTGSDLTVDVKDYSEIDINSFDGSSWEVLLVNKMHPIPEDYYYELGYMKSSWMQLDTRVIEPMEQMIAGARDDGVYIAVVSAYRSHEQQINLFNKNVISYMSSGYSYSDGYMLTSKYVTVPGTSEHEMGIAADILSYDYMYMNQGFAETDAAKWLKEHSWEYGFILRYPKGKEDVTGIIFEPWHFRYVGVEAAYYITSNDITLEEFTTLLNEAQYNN